MKLRDAAAGEQQKLVRDRALAVFPRTAPLPCGSGVHVCVRPWCLNGSEVLFMTLLHFSDREPALVLPRFESVPGGV